MRGAIVLMTLLVALVSAGPATDTPELAWNWGQWDRVPVQDGGRQKPLACFAAEAIRAMAIRGDLRDPETQQPLDPTSFYLKLLFDWQEWGRGRGSHLPDAAEYFGLHTPDKWDQTPLFRVATPQLRNALTIPQEQEYFSAVQLFPAAIRDPESGEVTPLLAWADSAGRRRSRRFTALENEALRLANGLRLYQAHRMGLRLKVLPIASSTERDWVSANELLTNRYDARSDPTGSYRQVARRLHELHTAYIGRSPDVFADVSADFISELAEVGPQLGDYPSCTTISIELAYNAWRPFRLAWILSISASVLVLWSLGTGHRAIYGVGLATYCSALLVMFIGLGLRIVISGRAPVTNMYESMIYMGFGTGLFGLLLGLKRRSPAVLVAASLISAIVLLLADGFPTVLDPSFQPLPPALRSDFWLVIHVMTVTFSYSAFALALGIGNITLGLYWVRSQDWDTIDALGGLNYRSMQVGVLFLAVGTLTGGIWADFSWGRFWGWDPKEVWALITLLGYLAVLHARYVHWVGRFGLAALSVICFSLVVIAWYGVNFVLGSGLHSYGFGSGGRLYVITWLFLQFVFVAVAAARSVGSEAGPRDSAAG